VVGPGITTCKDPEIKVILPGTEWVTVFVGERCDGFASGTVVGLLTTTNVWLLMILVLPTIPGKNGSTGTVVEWYDNC